MSSDDNSYAGTTGCPWGVAFGLALLLCTGSTRSFAAPQDDAATPEEARRELRGLPRVAAELDQLERSGELVRLAPHDLARILELSGHGTMSRLLESLDASGGVPSTEVAWTTARRALLDGALAEYPAWVASEVAPTGTRPGRLTRLVGETYVLLAQRGGAAELELARDLVAPHDPDERPDRALLRAYEAALRGMLGRDRRALRLLEDHWDEWPESLWLSTVKAVGGAESTEALDFLTWLLQDAEGTHLFLVQQIGRVAERAGMQGDFALHSLLIGTAASMDASLRRESCMTLGRLHCSEALGELIDLLQDDNAGVRDAAYWAVREITGKSMKAEPARWQRWYAGEERWWRDEFAGVREDLHADDLATVGVAVRAIGGRKLHRRELAAELIPLLEDRRVEVVRMTIAGLGALGSMTAVDPLVVLLEAEDAAVRGLALQALHSITGRRDLPPERAAWAGS